MPRCVGLLVLVGSLLGVLLFGIPSAHSLQIKLSGDLRLITAVEVDQPTVVGTGGGVKGRVTVTCEGGRHAFIVRQTSLVLHNVAVTNCSSAAIVLLGPGASLQASDVLFSSHSSPAGTQGLVIAAQHAAITLQRVVISGNTAGRTPPARNYSQQLLLHPACRDSSQTGGISTQHPGEDSSRGGGVISLPPPACGSPVLRSSLLALQDCSLTAQETTISGNIADAVIAATGSSQQLLQLLAGSHITNNSASWLFVADSWPADAVGRTNLMAPQPSENTQLLDMMPPFTARTAMGSIRERIAKDPAAVGVERLQAFVGAAPKGQTPLQLKLQQSSISGNTVTNGLLWLRLVNTSMIDVAVTGNLGTGSSGTWASNATAAGSQLAGAVATAAAGALAPPSPCDPAALHRALLQVHGPAAFDIHRCRFSSNVHLSGALLRVTDGFSLTSLRSSEFAGNIATALLRFEGRTWVLDTKEFFQATQYLDVLYYTVYEGSSQGAYKYAQKQHAAELARKESSSVDALWLMEDCTVTDNTVFHALLLSVGNRTSWREYITRKADVLEAGLSGGSSLEAEWVAKSLPLTNLAASWWVTGCKVHGNRLARRGVPAAAGAAHSADAGAVAPAATPAGKVAALAPAAAGQSSWAEWALAGPGASYEDAVSIAITAGPQLQADLASGGAICYRALMQAYQDMQTDLQLRRATHARLPSVIWTTFNQGYLSDTVFTNNTGFSHMLRHDNSLVTWLGVQLRDNAVAKSLVDLWYGDFWAQRAELAGNTAHNGSILDLESFIGSFKQVSVIGNIAGTLGASNATDGAHSSSASSSNSSSNSSGEACSLSPVAKLSHFESGRLHNVTLRHNTGSITLDINGFAFAEPVENVLVADNAASGIRMVSTQPRYNSQGISLSKVQVLRNTLSPAAPFVGGLVLGGFDSPVGDNMPVEIQDCEFTGNRPADLSEQGAARLSLMGGGVLLQGPAQDTSDPASQHGFLQKLAIRISNTRIAGNAAAEGGGLWTAWPLEIVNCEFRDNMATHAGGGLFMRGLQNDKLGSSGQAVLHNVTLANNVASFGGAIACDNCRALLLESHIVHNTAVRREPQASSQQQQQQRLLSSLLAGAADTTNATIMNSLGSNSNSSNTRQVHSCQGDGILSVPAPLMAYQVRGAGGAIAANMAGNSFLVLCSSSSLSGSTNALLSNHAQAVGGAFYVNHTVSQDCQGPQPDGPYSQACFEGLTGLSQHSCGLITIDTDWSNSSSDAGGDLLGWAGSDGFSMLCSGSAHSSNDSANCSSIPANSSSVVTLSGGFAGGGSSSSGNPEVCFVRYTARSAAACLPAGAIAVGSLEQKHNSSAAAASRMYINSPDLRFELPTSLGVFNSTCLRHEEKKENAGIAFNYSHCAVAGMKDASVPRMFSGDDMNFTVRLSGQEFGGQDNTFHAQLGTIQLHPSNDGLFVIGSLNTSMSSSGNALFSGMAMQPVQAPVSNRVYQFSFAASFGDDLLRQVQAVTVKVELLRCSWGQFMTINRCVRCNPQGTYSLHPDVQCQSCPDGGTCLKGLLIPHEGFFSWNPFVPQILRCPLQGGCQGDPHTNLEEVQSLMQLADARSSSSRRRRLRLQLRRLLQAAASNATGSSSNQPQAQPPVRLTARNAALFQYLGLLSDKWTADITDGVPVLADIDYAQLLSGWRDLQCSPGYTGMLCGTCDVNFTDLSGGAAIRYGSWMGSCVPCGNSASIWVALVSLFFVLFLYNAFGICMQLYAPQKRQPGAGGRPLSQHLYRSHAKRWRSLQQQVSANGSLSSRASITAATISEQGTALSGASHQPCMNGAAAAGAPTAAGHAEAAPAAARAEHCAAEDDAGPSPLQLRPSSLLGRPLKPIPSESLELSPFAVSSDRQLHQEELAGKGDTSAELPTVTNSTSIDTPAAAVAAGAGVQQTPRNGHALLPLPVALEQQPFASRVSRPARSSSGGSSCDYSDSLPLPDTHASNLAALSAVSSHSSLASCSSLASRTSLATRSRAGEDTVCPDATYLSSSSASQADHLRWHGTSAAAGAAAAADHARVPPSPTGAAGSGSVSTPRWQQQQHAGHAPARQRRFGRHEATELAVMAAAEAAAAAAAGTGPAAGAAAVGHTPQESVVVTCPSVGAIQSPAASAAQPALTAATSVVSASTTPTVSGPAGSANMGGPVSLLVGMWKIVTSYLQVLAMVRFVHLRSLPFYSYKALAFPDLSAFTSYVSFDCLLGGPQEYHAIIKTIVMAVGVPMLLLAAALAMWVASWAMHHAAARLHRQYGHAKWDKLRKLQASVSFKPDRLPTYLQPRMLITVIVLTYSCYPLITSSLLNSLACESIPPPQPELDPTGANYSRVHYNWLQYRAAAMEHTSSDGATNSSAIGMLLVHGSPSATAAAAQAEAETQLCAPGGRKRLDVELCWVAGMYWQQDYSIECFVGSHFGLAIFGMAGLLLFGLGLPVVAALLLWHNRKRLDDWEFAWKYSFLYSEYREALCFWEFAIMARKLLFLAVSILLPMAVSGTEEEVALLQLQVCVMLAVVCLLIQTSLRPYKRTLLNRLERVGLATIAISLSLLSCAVAVQKGQAVLFALLGVVNLAAVGFFVYHIFVQVWELVGGRMKHAAAALLMRTQRWLKGQQPHQQ